MSYLFINTYNNELRHLLTAKASESHFILCLPLHTPRFKLSWANDSHSFKLSISFLKSSSWTLQPRRERLRMLLSLRESQISLISSALSSSLQIWSVPKSIFVVQMGGNIYLEQRLSGKILWQSCPSPILIFNRYSYESDLWNKFSQALFARTNKNLGTSTIYFRFHSRRSCVASVSVRFTYPFKAAAVNITNNFTI